MKKLVLFFSFLFVVSLAFGDVFITELADPQNSSTTGRYVELYNNGASAVDLSTGWQLQRATNNNNYWQSAVDLTGTISAGGFYIVCNNQTFFTSTYGFAADQDIGFYGPADSNGDDQIRLLIPDSVSVDMFGVLGEDGSGTNHEFEDGRAERKATVTTGNTTYTFSEWNVWNDTGGAGTTNDPQYAPEDFDPGSWIGEPTDAPSITHTAQGNTTSTSDITISADITDTDLTTTTGSAPSCWYRIEGGSWTSLEDTTPIGDTFSWDIPGQSVHTLVEYYLAAQDDDSNVTTSPAGGSGTNPPGSTPPAYFHSFNVLKASPTIYDVQNYRDGSDNSYYSGETVSLTGIITGIYGTSDYVIQDGAGAWNGIWVSNNGSSLAEGHDVTVSGTIEESYNLTQLTTVTGTTTNSTGNPLPTVSTILTGALDESYEGVYVFVDDAVCTNASLGYGEWEITSATSTACRVDDLGYVFTPSLGNTYDVTGINYYSYGDFKIEPRYASDVVLGGDTIPPTITSVSVTDENTVEVNFSEDVEQTTAEITTNYTIITRDVTVTGAVLDIGDASHVTLTVTGMTVGNYTLSAVGVEDLSGNPSNDSENFSYTIPPEVGDIIVNEIMQNPSAVGDSHGEYIEFCNTTDHNIDINGWTVRDNGSDSFIIDNGGSLIISSYGYLVIGNDGNSGTNGGYTCDYQYSGMYLGNGDDEVILEYTGAIIDSVYYDGGATFPDPTGASMELDPAYMNSVDNDNGANWYEAHTQFGDGDNGTPGSANPGPLPDAPTDVIITINGNDVELNWTAVSGATGYNIYRSTDPYNFGSIAYDTSGINSYTDIGAASSDKYFYRVTATN